MPPKASNKTDKAATTGETTFRWTPENDRALLILCLGRTVGPVDYTKFVDALPEGANYQGIRQRVGKLRAEQKTKYDEMNWELTAEASVQPLKPKSSTASRKRKGKADEDEEGGEEPKPKKVQGKAGASGKKTKAVVKKEEMDEEEGDGVEGKGVEDPEEV
ncbi:hypothetical protein E8E13_007793 [Curvularia kusanoi]|uniref:Uncharacterized protein n=1 Tax=Curvularia kusanoi TaxID=90978 RepID=A0A9P4W521_CURKU|nr:hypothetical protein E8E13_007793 [Curvularia kusanoi]